MRLLAKWIAFPLVVLTFSGCSFGHTSTSDQIQALTPTEYRQALDEILETDKQYRTAISWGTTDPKELAKLEALDDDAHMAEWARRNRENISLEPEIEKELWKKQIAIDRKNTKKVMSLVKVNGWPTKDYLGDNFSDPIPVLIHMQPEDAEWVLPQLRMEVDAGRMEPKPYAMIYDRKQQHDGQPQLYGLMQAFDSKTRSILPPAIIDIDATNKARIEIGMEPLEEYRITDVKTASGQ